MLAPHPHRWAEHGRAGGPLALATGMPRSLVLDTNIVLDLLVFDDPAVRNLRVALCDGSLRWLATAAMRGELLRVLSYPQLASRLSAVRPPGGAPQRSLQGSGTSATAAGAGAGAVLAQFDRLSHAVVAALPAPVHCRDRDDQIFIDLAVAHRALLLSKDHQVLRLRPRLALFGVEVRAAELLRDEDPSSTIESTR